MIEIKLNQPRPKTKGTYLFKRKDDNRVHIATINEASYGLELRYGISVFPLTGLEKGDKWSIELKIS